MTRPGSDSDAAARRFAEADGGTRRAGRLLFWVPLAWSLFQLWYASPLPFLLDFGVLNDTQARSIHLAFAIFLAFVAFPAFRSSPRRRVPWPDLLLAVAAA